MVASPKCIFRAFIFTPNVQVRWFISPYWIKDKEMGNFVYCPAGCTLQKPPSKFSYYFFNRIVFCNIDTLKNIF